MRACGEYSRIPPHFRCVGVRVQYVRASASADIDVLFMIDAVHNA